MLLLAAKGVRTRKRPGGWGWLRTRCGRGGAVSSPVGWAGWAPSRRAGAPSGACRRTRRRRSWRTPSTSSRPTERCAGRRRCRQGHHRPGVARAGVAAVARRVPVERQELRGVDVVGLLPLRRRWWLDPGPSPGPASLPLRRGRAATMTTNATMARRPPCSHRATSRWIETSTSSWTTSSEPVENGSPTPTPTMAPALHTHQRLVAEPRKAVLHPHPQRSSTTGDLDQTPQPHHRPNPPRTHHTQPRNQIRDGPLGAFRQSGQVRLA